MKDSAAKAVFSIKATDTAIGALVSLPNPDGSIDIYVEDDDGKPVHVHLTAEEVAAEDE